MSIELTSTSFHQKVEETSTGAVALAKKSLPYIKLGVEILFPIAAVPMNFELAKNAATLAKKSLPFIKLGVETLFPVRTIARSARKLILDQTDKIHKHALRILTSLSYTLSNAALVGKAIALAGASLIEPAKLVFQTMGAVTAALGALGGIIGLIYIDLYTYNIKEGKEFHKALVQYKKSGSYTKGDWQEIALFFKTSSIDKYLQISRDNLLRKVDLLSQEILNETDQGEIDAKIDQFIRLVDKRISQSVEDSTLSLLLTLINLVALPLFFTPLAPMAWCMSAVTAIAYTILFVERKVNSYQFENDLQIIDRTNFPLPSDSFSIKDFFRWNIGKLPYIGVPSQHLAAADTRAEYSSF